MNIPVILAIAGVVLVGLGILGGGVSGYLGVPQLHPRERVLASFGGVMLLLAALILDRPVTPPSPSTSDSTTISMTATIATGAVTEAPATPITIPTLPSQPPTVIPGSPAPTPSSPPTEASLPTNIPVVANCPVYQESGKGQELSLRLDVAPDHIAFIDAWGFDDRRGGVFVTIRGPYQGQHTIIDGAFCGGINTGWNYEPVKQQRTSGLNPGFQEVFLP